VPMPDPDNDENEDPLDEGDDGSLENLEPLEMDLPDAATAQNPAGDA
jgi:hypothetical protein